MVQGNYELSPWGELDVENISQALAQMTLENKQLLAETAIKEHCYLEGRKDKYGKQFQYWLRWVMSDEPRNLLWWHWLCCKQDTIEMVVSNPGSLSDPDRMIDLRDRDAFSLALWQSIDEVDGVNHQARKDIEKRITHWSYYQDFFFDWFLKRYDLVSARSVLRPGFKSQYVHVLIAIFSFSAILMFFISDQDFKAKWLSVFGLVILTGIVGKLTSGLSLRHFIQSLIPRMFITTLVGTLALLSAKDILQVMFSDTIAAVYKLGVALAILALAFIYIVSTIQNRVRPRLRLRHTISRAAHVAIIALTYAVISTFLISPVMALEPYTFNTGASWSQLSGWFLTISMVLAFGVVLQLVWEDKPVTEPL